MHLFVINAGSSSLKFHLFNMPAEASICSGQVERIGFEDAVTTIRIFQPTQRDTLKQVLHIPDHEAGLMHVVNVLQLEGAIKNPDDISIVGHRVVHGGEKFTDTVQITPAVKEEIKALFSLAPLHNPPNYMGIEVAEKIFPSAAQVAVFDTAFHQTMPAVAYRYAIPDAYYSKDGIRAYGFHGTSHRCVSRAAAQLLNKPSAKLITMHLGNGCSMAAICNGQSVDTSMGFGPVSGLVMGTRAGDIDAAVLFHLMDVLGMSSDELNAMLNKQSGLLGLSGFSDMREVRAAAKAGNEKASFALELYAYRIKKYIGAYVAVMNGLDALVFTAGVGENDADLREKVCTGLDYLGVHLDALANRQPLSGLRSISRADSPVAILVVPTNEELEIARQCFSLLHGS